MPWLIVGLRNPGKKYTHTRHNLGGRLVETLREHLGQPPFRLANNLHARISAGAVMLAIPATFMNDSGRAVAALVKHCAVPLYRLVIVHDDKDLAFGNLKLQWGRGAAGHKGVQSIIDTLGTDSFWRLRMGIGAPPADIETDKFVLEKFTGAEEVQLANDVIPRALALIEQHVGR